MWKAAVILSKEEGPPYHPHCGQFPGCLRAGCQSGNVTLSCGQGPKLSCGHLGGVWSPTSKPRVSYRSGEGQGMDGPILSDLLWVCSLGHWSCPWSFTDRAARNGMLLDPEGLTACFIFLFHCYTHTCQNPLPHPSSQEELGSLPN